MTEALMTKSPHPDPLPEYRAREKEADRNVCPTICRRANTRFAPTEAGEGIGREARGEILRLQSAG
jgi:hypothetical protein